MIDTESGDHAGWVTGRHMVVSDADIDAMTLSWSDEQLRIVAVASGFDVPFDKVSEWWKQHPLRDS